MLYLNGLAWEPLEPFVSFKNTYSAQQFVQIAAEENLHIPKILYKAFSAHRLIIDNDLTVWV